MKKICTLVLALILMAGLVACKSESAPDDRGAKEPTVATTGQVATDEKTLSEETLAEITYKVPSEWRREDADNGYYYYLSEKNSDGFLYVSYSRLLDDLKVDELDDDEVVYLFDSVISGMTENDSGMDVISQEYNRDILEFPSAHIVAATTIDGVKYGYICDMFITNTALYSLSVVERSAEGTTLSETLASVTGSIVMPDSVGDSELEAIAKELGYDFIFQFEDSGKIYHTGVKTINDGDLYDAVSGIAENSRVMTLHELDNAYAETDVSVSIHVNAESADELISLAEAIFKEREVRHYDKISVSPESAGISGNISINWDAKNGRYFSACTDFTNDKSIELAYNENDLFSKIDMMAQFKSDLDDIARKYGFLG